MNCRTLLCHWASVLLSPISHVVASRYTASSDAIMKQNIRSVDICTSLPCIWPSVHTDIVSRMNYIKTVNQNTRHFIHEYPSENIVCEKAAIVFRGGWVSCIFWFLVTSTPPLRQCFCYVLMHRKTRNLDGLSIFASCFFDLALGRKNHIFTTIVSDHDMERQHCHQMRRNSTHALYDSMASFTKSK